jgi:hypothetical protein
MADQLDERFPFEFMEVYQLVQVVDPRPGFGKLLAILGRK